LNYATLAFNIKTAPQTIVLHLLQCVREPLRLFATLRNLAFEKKAQFACERIMSEDPWWQ
jgi:hypothetical protein